MTTEQLTQIYQAINAVSQRVNDLSKRLEDYVKLNHGNNVANIDYLAMMSDIELPSDEDKRETTENE